MSGVAAANHRLFFMEHLLALPPDQQADEVHHLLADLSDHHKEEDQIGEAFLAAANTIECIAKP